MAAGAVTHEPRHSCGLYVITEDRPLGGRGRSRYGVEAALRGGARVVQYRDKSEDRARRLEEARALESYAAITRPCC